MARGQARTELGIPVTRDTIAKFAAPLSPLEAAYYKRLAPQIEAARSTTQPDAESVDPTTAKFYAGRGTNSGGQSPAPHPDRGKIIAQIDALKKRHESLLKASGAKVVEDTTIEGMAYDPERNEIIFNPDDIAATAQIIAERVYNPDSWMDHAFQEEAWHAADATACGAQFFAIHERLSHLLEAAGPSLRPFYTGKTPKEYWSSEYIRMLWQLRETGTFTELRSGRLEPEEEDHMKRMLRQPQLPEIEQHIARIERFIASKKGSH